MTKQIEFPDHVSYTQQAKNSTILTTTCHTCMYWHAEVCEKIAGSDNKTCAISRNVYGIAAVIKNEIRDPTEANGRRYAVPVCRCICHWQELKPALPPTIAAVAVIPSKPPAPMKRKSPKNGKHKK